MKWLLNDHVILWRQIRRKNNVTAQIANIKHEADVLPCLVSPTLVFVLRLLHRFLVNKGIGGWQRAFQSAVLLRVEGTGLSRGPCLLTGAERAAAASCFISTQLFQRYLSRYSSCWLDVAQTASPFDGASLTRCSPPSVFLHGGKDVDRPPATASTRFNGFLWGRWPPESQTDGEQVNYGSSSQPSVCHHCYCFSLQWSQSVGAQHTHTHTVGESENINRFTKSLLLFFFFPGHLLTINKINDNNSLVTHLCSLSSVLWVET